MQGEVDVVAVKPGDGGATRVVYLCEVITHIQCFNTKTVLRIRDKLARLREFADVTFPEEEHRFRWLEPGRGQGLDDDHVRRALQGVGRRGRSLELVINEEYTRRIGQLVAYARANPSATSEPAYRMLQILRLRGERPKL